jgi:hypothetical protein
MKKMYNYLLFFLSIFFLDNISAQDRIINVAERDSIVKKLENMYNDYQEYRLQILYGTTDKNEIIKYSESKDVNRRIHDVIANGKGLDKKIIDSFNNLIKTIDSINFIKIITIYEKYGYLNEEIIGEKKIITNLGRQLYAKDIFHIFILEYTSKNEFLILYSILKRELEKKNIERIEFAEWYDKSMLMQNKKQLYGIFIANFPCVENLEITNQEREKIGLKKLTKNNCK